MAKEKLLEIGKKDGHLEQRDIFKEIADTPDNLDLLDALYAEMTEAGVDLVVPTSQLQMILVTNGLPKTKKQFLYHQLPI